MRRIMLVVGCLSLLAAGCGDDDATPTTAPATTPPTTTAAAQPTTPSTDPATTPATTPATDPATTPVASDGPATTVAAPGTAVAPLVPEAVCVGNDGGEVYFAYENGSTEAVVVTEGDANVLTGGMANDNPLVTTLFAPGRVDPAFWAYFPEHEAETEPDPLVWTLVGPDGVERQAVADDSLLPCPAGYPNDAVDDPRMPTLEVVSSELTADGTSAEVQLELTGVPEASVCNPAFEPEPVLVSIGDGTSLPTAYEPTTTVVAGPFRNSASGGQVAPVYVYPLIVDQCSADGVTVQTWSAADALRSLTFVAPWATVCARLDDAGTLSVTLYDSCDGLPSTGGSSIRPQ